MRFISSLHFYVIREQVFFYFFGELHSMHVYIHTYICVLVSMYAMWIISCCFTTADIKCIQEKKTGWRGRVDNARD